jgi:hypothetical protein
MATPFTADDKDHFDTLDSKASRPRAWPSATC